MEGGASPVLSMAAAFYAQLVVLPNFPASQSSFSRGYPVFLGFQPNLPAELDDIFPCD